MGMSNYQELTERAIALVNDDRWDEAFDDLKRREADGDKNAVAVLAQFYLYGVGIAQDEEYAVELFNKAIEMGSPDAAWELGLLYYKNDIGFPTSISKAVELFEKGAQGGNENCYGALSECYLRGDESIIDEGKAFQYALMAAKAGNATGMINAAICYDDGLGTKSDPFAACHWYKEYLNFDPEDDFAMLRIALCLADPYQQYGIQTTGEMLNEAFYYAGQALERGNVEAHLIIGWFYERGEVVPQDFDLAHKYIQLAADNGNEIAQRHLLDFRKNLYGYYCIPGL